MMNSDRSWMDLPRLMDAYKEGVEYFVNFAYSNSKDGLILCPCKVCRNGVSKEPKVVKSHLITEGFIKDYTRWVLHGEKTIEKATM